MRIYKSVLLSTAVVMMLSGCASQKLVDKDIPAANFDKTVEVVQTNTEAPKPTIDLTQVKPNESGTIMVVMFHNFVKEFTPSKYDKGEYTTTFDSFRKLLPELYDKGYRLINVNDYLENNISAPAGFMPIMFTFDDGTAGQFNLVEEDGKLVANKDSAVGIMEEFNKQHPDFGLKGTFYVNLGLETFKGKGTEAERLKYLIDKGFEIGNHTLTHIHLNEVKDKEKILSEVGGNQKKMLELIPGYYFKSLALPFGQATKDLAQYVAKGEYQGVKYENIALMEVGWKPATGSVSKSFNPLSTMRVRASGINPVDTDCAWWLKNMSKAEQYVSDGDANTVAIPTAKEGSIDSNKLQGKTLVKY